MDLRYIDPLLTEWIYKYANRIYGPHKRGAITLAIQDAIRCLKEYEAQFLIKKSIFSNDINMSNV